MCCIWNRRAASWLSTEEDGGGAEEDGPGASVEGPPASGAVDLEALRFGGTEIGPGGAN